MGLEDVNGSGVEVEKKGSLNVKGYLKGVHSEIFLKNPLAFICFAVIVGFMITAICLNDKDSIQFISVGLLVALGVSVYTLREKK